MVPEAAEIGFSDLRPHPFLSFSVPMIKIKVGEKVRGGGECILHQSALSEIVIKFIVATTV